jgi:hypothetical protein
MLLRAASPPALDSVSTHAHEVTHEDGHIDAHTPNTHYHLKRFHAADAHALPSPAWDPAWRTIVAPIVPPLTPQLSPLARSRTRPRAPPDGMLPIRAASTMWSPAGPMWTLGGPSVPPHMLPGSPPHPLPAISRHSPSHAYGSRADPGTLHPRGEWLPRRACGRTH